MEHDPRVDSGDASAAARTGQLLERSRGLNVKGFFIVDRTMFPTLLGHFLTYLVILIQFRMSETPDETELAPKRPTEGVGHHHHVREGVHAATGINATEDEGWYYDS